MVITSTETSLSASTSHVGVTFIDWTFGFPEAILILTTLDSPTLLLSASRTKALKVFSQSLRSLTSCENAPSELLVVDNSSLLLTCTMTL